MNPCTNCGQPTAATDYCRDCEQFREKLEALRRAQQRYWAGRRGPLRKTPPQRGSHAFKEQCARYGAQLLAEGKLPISGQDAALPPGDRE